MNYPNINPIAPIYPYEPTEFQEYIPAQADPYKPLKDILDRAYFQASSGKGKERHANGLPFVDQPILQETRNVGIGFPLGQARKKVLEAYNCSSSHQERAIADLLGAINYIAATIIYLEESKS